MTWPTPQPGLLIRYAYLWEREARAGRSEGIKDRPCAVILMSTTETGAIVVRVLPVTHSPPSDPSEAIEIPRLTKERLGLDSERSWIILAEANEFVWPGPDLRPSILGDPQSVAIGMLPPGFMKILRDRLISLWRQRRAISVRRSD